MKVTFELPLKIQSLNVGNRMTLSGLTAARRQRFAMRRRVKLQRMAAHLGLLNKLPKATHEQLWAAAVFVVVTLTRGGPDTLDSEDNLTAAFKAVRDGIAGALEVNDAHPLLRWLYAQRKGGRGVYSAHVMIETMTKPEFIARLVEIEGARP